MSACDHCKIIHVPQLGGTEFFGFATEANAYLLMHGLSDPTISLSGWDSEAIVALDPDDAFPVGIITYFSVKHTQSYSIGVGYVRPSWRQGGLYRRLWNFLVQKARAKDILTIIGATRMDNLVMRDVARKLGRVEEAVSLVYKL